MFPCHRHSACGNFPHPRNPPTSDHPDGDSRQNGRMRSSAANKGCLKNLSYRHWPEMFHEPCHRQQLHIFPTVVFVAKLNPALFPNAQTFQIPLKNRRRRHPMTQNVRRQQIGIIAAQKGIQTGHLARCSGKQSPAPVFKSARTWQNAVPISL